MGNTVCGWLSGRGRTHEDEAILARSAREITAGLSGAAGPSTGSPEQASEPHQRKLARLQTGQHKRICKHGIKCYRKNPEHLNEEAHPADTDYLKLCKLHKTTPEIVSVWRLFEWCDGRDCGKATREDLERCWQIIGEHVPGVRHQDLTDQLWDKFDHHSSNWVNFFEFSDFCIAHATSLPLGLDALLVSETQADLRCGVGNCACSQFVHCRARCKYGKECYNKADSHLKTYAHVGEDDWKQNWKRSDANMCTCGHKRALHSSSAKRSAAVPYPAYWRSHTVGDSLEFRTLASSSAAEIADLQELVNFTYSDVTTRDRANHGGGSWMVPRNYTVKRVLRNENSKLWRKYMIKKAEQQLLKKLRDQELDDSFKVFDDVLTTKKWESLGHDEMDSSINEWYLFHGTTISNARSICANDFKVSLAGTATGSLYGAGLYFAESITKADEYSKAEEHEKEDESYHCVLLCRVLGGRVRYNAEKAPDAEALTQDCVEGAYDCIIGDRKKASATYREFILFDTEDVYPEYMLMYERGEFFKSKSHP